MPNRAIPYVKVLVHLLCLLPIALLYVRFRSGAIALAADPIAWVTHFTGDWALWLLLVSLAVTPLRRLHPKLGNLIRFRRLLGLYAFVYATLHLLVYIFLFSGYDVQSAWAGISHGKLGAIWTQWAAIWPFVLDDLKKRRFIQVGLLAWVILLALTVTSPTYMLRRMGGKNWQRVHRLVYGAAIAGCVHYWWLVKAGVTTPLPDTIALTVLFAARIVWVAMKRRRQSVSPARVVGRVSRPTSNGETV
jgi:sulfoxide reductase heme-binding subunit YedZ